MNICRGFWRLRYGILAGIAAAVLLGLCSPLAADKIIIGNSWGEVFARDEFSLETFYPAGYTNFGSGMPVLALKAGIEGDIAIGLDFAFGPDGIMRKSYDLVSNITQVATGGGVSALAVLPNGNVVLGQHGLQPNLNGVFVRRRTDLTQRPPEYTGIYGDGGNFNAPISGLGSLSNGNVIVITNGAPRIGQVMVRKSTDVFTTAPGAAHDNVDYGTPITAMTVVSDDKFVVGLDYGLVDCRSWTDVWASVSNVNFGIKITALATLPNGKVVIGLNNGEVHVRDPLDLPAQSSTSAVFTDNVPITALAVTSNGNVVIGTADGWVFVRRGDNLGLAPAGYSGLNPLNFNSSVNALATSSAAGPPLISIDEAKKLGDGALVNLTNKAVTASFFAGFPGAPEPIGFGIEETDRNAGIRVIWDQAVTPGARAAIQGTIDTVSGERVIQANSVITVSGDPIDPLAMSNRASGGGTYFNQGAVVDQAPGVMSVGTSSIGLLVTIFGKVTYVNDTGDWFGYFYVDDGSGISDGSGKIGIKCRPWLNSETGIMDFLPTEGDYVAVTGVLGVQKIAGVNARYMWTKSVRYFP